jgi:hypothetical protein
MSLIPAVERQIAGRLQNDPVRITLEFLLERGAVGWANPVSITTVTRFLNDQGIDIEYKNVQQQIMGASRHGDFFIGSSSRGIFLIDAIEDAERMRDFYLAKIQSQQENLERLRIVANRIGWDLGIPE